MTILLDEPAAIKRIFGQGFADYTITRRLPKVLSSVEEQLAACGKLEAASTMLQDIIDAREINIQNFACPTLFWEEYINGLNGCTWGSLAFFDLEFLFYHGLNSIAGFFETGLDIFRNIREMALAEAIPSLESGLAQMSDLSDTDLLKATINCSLFANEADYSQLITSKSDSKLWDNRILFDESDDLILQLHQLPYSEEVHLIADNAGHELCWDLVMIDVLLRLFGNLRIFLHVKPSPMFVSDALSSDVEETLNSLSSISLSRETVLMSQRLKYAMESGKLCVCAEADWGEPRHFNRLDSDLSITLSNSKIIISKGDLNYRRFVKDLQWPFNIPVEVATSGVPFKAFSLRVLKSDALVGITSTIAKKAETQLENWRTCGHFAVIQQL